MSTSSKNNYYTKAFRHRAIRKHLIILGTTFLTLFSACDNDSKTTSINSSEENSEIIAITNKTISGLSQKGPFINGSNVVIQELDSQTLYQTGRKFDGIIKNDIGKFSIKVKEFNSRYALLKTNGFYRNEITGNTSEAPITLFALADIYNRDEVNVNLLTHLTYERSIFLATTDTLSISNAKKQAELEVLKSFGISGILADAEDLSIFGKSDQNAALLAISILMQGNLSEGDFSERLANYATDIETDGIWNDIITATLIADWAYELWIKDNYYQIRANIANWKLTSDIPPFEKYINSFWWNNYGLGICNSKREGEVLKNQNTTSTHASEYYICKAESWLIANDIEKDTYKWDEGKDGDCKTGSINSKNYYVFENKTWRRGNTNDCTLNLRGCTALHQDSLSFGSDKVWYICDSLNWREATTYEKDTFGWKDSTEGAIKKGNTTDTIYVFNNTAWKIANNTEATLGGCVPTIADSVGKVNQTYYICKSNKWIKASTFEYDTYKWAEGNDGDSRIGNVNPNNCYVYENKVWRNGNTNDCTLNLRGCTTRNQDTIGLGSDNVWYICKEHFWRKAANIEIDTITWGSGKFSGEIKAGQINKNAYYYYDSEKKAWREASTFEKDTYDYANNKPWSASSIGDLKKGAVTDTFYVYDIDGYRFASNREAHINQVCTSSIENFINTKSDTSDYICKQREWTVYKKQFLDSRDNQVYSTVRIGKQIWMAEDLNFADSINYENLKGASWIAPQDHCNNRYYTWTAAMNISQDFCKKKYAINSRQGICPDGWHIPSEGEWNELISFVGGDEKAYYTLKDFGNTTEDYPPKDMYGFNAIINEGGLYIDAEERDVNSYINCSSTNQHSYCFNDDGIYFYEVGGSSWWSSSDISENYAIKINLPYCCETKAIISKEYKKSAFAVRCVKDEE